MAEDTSRSCGGFLTCAKGLFGEFSLRISDSDEVQCSESRNPCDEEESVVL